MPDAMVGTPYFNVRINPPIGVTDGPHLEWNFTFPTQLNWLNWTHLPDAVDGQGNPIGGGVLNSTIGGNILTPSIHGQFFFSLEIFNTDTGRPIDIYTFEIIVRLAGADPAILTTELPDAMLGAEYYAPIRTANFQTPGEWRWRIPPGGGALPDSESLRIWFNPYDPSRGAIEGEPVAVDIEEGPIYNFRVVIEPQGGTGGLDITSENFSIRIWNRPIITPVMPAPGPGIPVLPRLFDGIANINGLEKDYKVEFSASTPNVLLANDPLDVYPDIWSWHIFSGIRPPGLYLPIDNTGTTTELSGPPSTAGLYTFTIQLRANPRVIQVVQGDVTATFSIEILQPPGFDMSIVDRIITLADGMADRPPSSDEPEEPPDWYNEQIRMAGFPAGTRWTWRLATGAGAGALPPGLNTRPVLPVDNLIPMPGAGGTTYSHNLDLHGIPAYNAGGDHRFTLELECIDPINENIDGAKITQVFEVKIWPRTYLYAAGIGATGRFYVRRDDDIRGEPTWADLNTGNPLTELAPWEGRRAVMPGNRAIISTNSGGAFVLWEVSHPFDANGVTTSTVYTAGTNRFVALGGIGGPDSGPSGVRTGYGIHAGQHAYVLVNMPNTSTTGIYDGNVYLRAAQLGVGRPDITGSPDSRHALRQGTVGTPYDATIAIHRDDVGGGPGMGGARPGEIWWQIIPGSGELPGGLDIEPFAATRAEIAGTPTVEGLFNFSVSMTLPGSMRIERDFSIFINPWDGMGDVFEDGTVDLRDLVMLIRWQDDESLPINMRNARLSTNGEGNHRPGSADIRLLARYFTSSEGSFRPP
jgi:hypothetical protein